ncbi:uncharacterized protein ACRADG_002045 [Cochliomyia hominivorax]
MKSAIKSETIFRRHFIWWRILGFFPTVKYRYVYITYSIFLNTMVTIVYPIHLLIGLLRSTSMYDTIKNLAVVVTALVCATKTFVIWLKFENIKNMVAIIQRQDKRICLDKEEYHYYKYVILRDLRLILQFFMSMYAVCWITCEIPLLYNGFLNEWGLMYPAYFPFDPFASSTGYIVAHVYQFVGVSFLILQNTVHDSFAAIHLALLSGQLHMLGVRLAKLGSDKNKTLPQHNQDLLECIQDHKDLLDYRSKLEEILSLYMFFQVIFASINMCSSIVFLILFADDPWTIVHYISYLLSMMIEILPVCYYGTIMEIKFEHLTYALFSSNWLDKDAIFKQNLRIFAECTKKPMYIMAWLFRVNLNLFIGACKNAYSLFALIMNMKCKNIMTGIFQIENIFRKHFLYWRILGLLPSEKYPRLYKIYTILINLSITLGYPLHLVMGLFMSTTFNDVIQILAINLTCIVCSLKTLIIWKKFENLNQIMEILRRQDERISQDKDELNYYKFTVIKQLKNIYYMFLILYGASWIFSESSILINGFMGNWTLLFPAYFPFDVYASTVNYSLAHIYQYLGITFQTLQGLANDTFLSMQLALLSGQLHALALRVTKLARDHNKSHKENNQELLKCIQDHKDLLRYRLLLEDIISLCMFFQLLITSINMCTSIVFLILFANDPFTLIFYFVYFLAITGQIFPICYYGSETEMEFQNLTYALFSSNWLDQDVTFKRNLRIFAETTKKPLYISGLLFKINLNLFMAVCKNSYSLFALIMNLK